MIQGKEGQLVSGPFLLLSTQGEQWAQAQLPGLKLALSFLVLHHLSLGGTGPPSQPAHSFLIWTLFHTKCFQYPPPFLFKELCVRLSLAFKVVCVLCFLKGRAIDNDGSSHPSCIAIISNFEQTQMMSFC